MILEKLSRHIAIKIKLADPEGPGTIEILEYGIGLKLNLYIGFVLTLMFGIIFNDVIDSVIALVAFMTLRKYSGGVHLPITICSVVTALFSSLTPLVELNYITMIMFTMVTLVIVILFAPNNFEDTEIVKFEPFSKVIAAVFVLTNFYFQSSTLALIFFIQAVLILPIYSKKGGES